MIVRTLQNADEEMGWGLAHAKQLVHLTDGMGYSLNDIFIPAEKVTFPATSQAQHARIFYIVSGSAHAFVKGNVIDLQANSMLAVKGKHAIELEVFSSLRLICVDSFSASPKTAYDVRHLHELLGSTRDLFWGNGQSRRFLIKSDGWGIALCNTTGRAGSNSMMEYQNHWESCYYLQGEGEYVWEGGRHPILTGVNQSTMFIMDQHDSHHMHITQDSICLSFFYPPLEGHEVHDFSRKGYSSY